MTTFNFIVGLYKIEWTKLGVLFSKNRWVRGVILGLPLVSISIMVMIDMHANIHDGKNWNSKVICIEATWIVLMFLFLLSFQIKGMVKRWLPYKDKGDGLPEAYRMLQEYNHSPLVSKYTGIITISTAAGLIILFGTILLTYFHRLHH